MYTIKGGPPSTSSLLPWGKHGYQVLVVPSRYEGLSKHMKYTHAYLFTYAHIYTNDSKTYSTHIGPLFLKTTSYSPLYECTNHPLMSV